MIFGYQTYEMENRLDLAKYFNELGFKVGAEVGVFDGYFSEELCKAIPGLKLFSIDGWQIYGGYRNTSYQKMLDGAYEITKKRLKPYNAEVIKKFSLDAIKDFEDESLDFVYLDGNHEYEYVKQDIEAWTPKVKKGGIVSGHDYYESKSGRLGVIKAIDEYITEHGYKLNTTEWNKDTYKDNRQPSWWFVKE